MLLLVFPCDASAHFVIECSCRCVRQTMNNIQPIPRLYHAFGFEWHIRLHQFTYITNRTNHFANTVCKKLTKQTLCLNMLVTRRDYVGEREIYIICWAVSVLFISNWSEYRQLPYHYWMVHVWFLVDAPTDIVISLVSHLH